jgi:hypothetical protein
MFGQSFFLTSISLNMTRRVTFTACRFLGKPLREAAEIADDVAISAASVIGTAAAIVTLDPAGGAASAGYIVLEHAEAQKRATAAPKAGV